MFRNEGKRVADGTEQHFPAKATRKDKDKEEKNSVHQCHFRNMKLDGHNTFGDVVSLLTASYLIYQIPTTFVQSNN